MITDKLNSKLSKAKALTKKLDRSLALEWLWPEAFNHGRARAYWTGKQPRGMHLTRNDPTHLHHEFRITDGDGEMRSFSYDDTPEILGGGLPTEMYRRVTNLTKG